MPVSSLRTRLRVALAGAITLSFICGCGSESDSEEQRPVLLEGRESLGRAGQIVRASGVFGEYANWRDAQGADSPEETAQHRKRLAETRETCGDDSEIGEECRRIEAQLDRLDALRIQLDQAKQEFVTADPGVGTYGDFQSIADTCRQLGIARLTTRAVAFARALGVARGGDVVVRRLVPLTWQDFYRETTISPLKSASTESRLMDMARFHANVRNADAATRAREQLAAEKRTGIIAGNRTATADNPLLMLTPEATSSVARAIEARSGSTVVLVWTPRHDTCWEIADGAEPTTIDTLQSHGFRLAPTTESSLTIRVPGTLLASLSAWLGQQRRLAGKGNDVQPATASPLFHMSPVNIRRYMQTGSWDQAVTIVISGELAEDRTGVSPRAVLSADSMVAALPPGRATLRHNRKHLGLAGRVFRPGSSFPVTVHWPRSTARFRELVRGTFSPFRVDASTVITAAEYLQALCVAEQPRIDRMNEAVTKYLLATVENSRSGITDATMGELQKQLAPLVGANQSRIDSRLIVNAGFRAIQGADRFAIGSGDLFSDGALYLFNLRLLETAISSRGHQFLFDRLLDSAATSVIAHDGIWFLSITEAIHALDKALLPTGFDIQEVALPDPAGELEKFHPVPPLPAPDPLLPEQPMFIVQPTDADARAAWQLFMQQRSATYETALQQHAANRQSGTYNSHPRWISYKRSTEAWRTSVRKTGLQWQRRRRVLLQQVEAREGQVAEWKTFAATAIARTKQRAGRPLKPQPARDGEIPENVALVPSIEQLLVVQLPMAAVNSEKTSLALFETFDRNRDRKLTRGEAYEHSPLFAMAEACDLDGAPESVSQREWILIVRVVRRQTGGGTRAAETLQLLLEGPKAILRQNPMPGRPGAR
jgi:hypothetical protein